MTHPSGPLGTFSTKINLAVMLGHLSERAWKDLVIIKDLRNEFAHLLDVEGFNDRSVAARCMNLSTVADHVVDAEELVRLGEESISNAMAMKEPERGKPPAFAIGGSGATTELKDPRWRFIWSARAFTFAFGMGDKPWPYGPQI